MSTRRVSHLVYLASVASSFSSYPRYKAGTTAFLTRRLSISAGNGFSLAVEGLKGLWMAPPRFLLVSVLFVLGS